MNKKALAIAAVFIISFAIYLNSLGNEPVRDDKHFVLANEWITDVSYIPEILTHDVYDIDDTGIAFNQYRPVFHLVLMLDYHLFGDALWGYHVVNMLFHSFSSILLFLIAGVLIGRGGGGPPGAESKATEPFERLLIPLFAALVFAAHPINTESVGWIAAIADLTFVFFSLLSFYLYLTARSMAGGRYVASLIFFFIAACSKETSVALPALIFAVEITLRRATLLNTVKRLVPFAAVGLLYLLVRMSVLDSVVSGSSQQLAGYPPSLIFLNALGLLAQYLGKLVIPINLCFDYVFAPINGITEPRGITAAVTALLLVVLMWRLWRAERLLFFALAWVLLPLMPVMYIPALGINAFTERYFYLSTAGFGLFVSVLAAKCALYVSSERAGGVKRAATLLMAATLIVTSVYSVGTVMRNITWSTALSLWGDTVDKSPDSRIARNNYGIELFRAGRPEEAVAEFNEAKRIDPESPLAYNNTGIVYAGSGMIREAAREFEEALRLSPSFEEARANLERATAIIDSELR